MRNHGFRPSLLLLLFGLVACAANEQTDLPEVEVRTPPRNAVCERDSEGNYVFVIGENPEGVSLRDFIKAMRQETTWTFLLPAEDEIGNRQLNMIGTKRVPEEDLMNFVQTIFFTHGLAVMPLEQYERCLLVEPIRYGCYGHGRR